MDRDATGFHFHCFPGACAGIGGFPVDLQSGIDRRHLFNGAREAGEDFPHLFQRRPYLRSLYDHPLRIQRIGLLPEADGELIGLVAV
jgi:hypothetical protein